MTSELGRERRVLVLGTPRGGTKYMAAVLRAAGLDVGHEETGTEGTVTHYFVIDTDDYSLAGRRPQGDHPDERRSDFDFRFVLHQTRHPLPAIASIRDNMGARYFRWVARHTHLNADWPPLYRAAWLWLHWHVRIDAQSPDLTFAVEHLADEWEDVCDQIGLFIDFPRHVEYSTSRSRNHPLGWSELDDMDPVLSGRIREKAMDYGYAP